MKVLLAECGKPVRPDEMTAIEGTCSQIPGSTRKTLKQRCGCSRRRIRSNSKAGEAF